MLQTVNKVSVCERIGTSIYCIMLTACYAITKLDSKCTACSILLHAVALGTDIFSYWEGSYSLLR